MSKRIELTRDEALGFLLLTGPNSYDTVRKNFEKAKTAFPQFSKVLLSASIPSVDSGIERMLRDYVMPKLAELNEEIINKERTEREAKERQKTNDLFYKAVTTLLKNLNDTGWLTGNERLRLATDRYPEADIRVNVLGKLEYFGRKLDRVPVPKTLADKIKEDIARNAMRAVMTTRNNDF